MLAHRHTVNGRLFASLRMCVSVCVCSKPKRFRLFGFCDVLNTFFFISIIHRTVSPPFTGIPIAQRNECQSLFAFMNISNAAGRRPKPNSIAADKVLQNTSTEFRWDEFSSLMRRIDLPTKRRKIISEQIYCAFAWTCLKWQVYSLNWLHSARVCVQQKPEARRWTAQLVPQLKRGYLQMDDRCATQTMTASKANKWINKTQSAKVNWDEDKWKKKTRTKMCLRWRNWIIQFGHFVSSCVNVCVHLFANGFDFYQQFITEMRR